MRDIAKNIRDARIKSNLTQDELAEKLFVTRQTVSNYETGKSRPDIDMLLSIAEVLGTDVNILLYGKSEEVQKKSVPRSFWIGLAITLLLAVLNLFYGHAMELARNYINFWPAHLLRLHIRPMCEIFFGWTLMCGIGIISGAKPPEKTWCKYSRWVLYLLLISYFVLMMPLLLHELKGELVHEFINKLREASEFSISYHSGFELRPHWLNMLQGNIFLFIVACKPIFIFFGTALWLSGFPKRGEKNFVPLLLGLIVALTLYIGAEEKFVLEVENPEQLQSLPYGIEVIAPSE